MENRLMWEWIQTTLYQLINSMNINKRLISEADKDDIVQNVMLYLIQNEKTAIDVYENNKKAFLLASIKREIYRQECSVSKLSNTALLYRLQTILKCCNDYKIAPSPDNAYKISIILNSSDYHYNIKNVRIILTDYANLITQNIFQKGFL